MDGISRPMRSALAVFSSQMGAQFLSAEMDPLISLTLLLVMVLMQFVICPGRPQILV
jgi:hypothetical protein